MPFPLIPGAEGILLRILSPASLRALNATSQRLRQQVQEHTCSLQLKSNHDIPLLLKHRWPSLTQLKLDKTQLSQDELALLAENRAASLPALKRLSIGPQMMDPDTLQTLAHQAWSSLTSLDLSSDRQVSADTVLVACRHLAASNLPELAALRISGCMMTGPAMAQLATRDWPLLCSLDFNSDYANITFLPQLSAARWTSLRSLSLRHSILGLNDVHHLQQADWPHLTKLDLHSCHHYSNYEEDWDPNVEALTVSWCRHVAAGKWPHLAVLDLGHNRLSAAPMAELAKGSWPALRKLSLTCCMDGFLYPLVSAPWPALEELDLRSCELTQLDVQHLQHAHWPKLLVLDFHSTRVEDAEHDMAAFYKMWELAQQQWPLVKFRTGFTSEFYNMTLTGWHTLRWLDVTNSPLTPDQVVTLLQARGHILDTLHVSCIAGAATEAKPEVDNWPVNTYLSLEVNLHNAVVQSLSVGHWPAFRMKGSSVINCRQAACAITHMIGLELHSVQELDMSCSFSDCCDCEQHGVYIDVRRRAEKSDTSAKPAAVNSMSLGFGMLQGFDIFHQALWRKLRRVNLSHNGLTEEFVLPIVASRWPMLEMLDLSDNKLGLGGVKQLVNAHWPLLTGLNVRRNAFNKGVMCKPAKATLLGHFRSTWPLLCVLLDYDDGDTMLDSWNSSETEVVPGVVQMT